MKESIYAAIRGEYGKRVLPPVGTAYDEEHTVIVCSVCKHRTLDNYDICRHCGWEYDGFPEDHYSAANSATLAEYREYYKKAVGERNTQDV
jgi:ribosomal protein L37AE/L43A